jgi:hypothetical protein
MEVATLIAFLSPFFPALLNLGGKAVEKATESAAGKFGEAAFKKAEAMWPTILKIRIYRRLCGCS